MKKLKLLAAALVLFSIIALASSESRASNPLFAGTHMQETPFTLPAGKLVYGTSFALGITDFFQVSTNVVRDAYQFFNAQGKFSMVDNDVFAFSPYVGYETFNYHNISDYNPDLRVSSWMPGATLAIEVVPQALALFLGGNANITKTVLKEDDFTESGLIRGAVIGSDIGWAYNAGGDEDEGNGKKKSKRKHGSGNMLSAGVTYDINYKLFGIGLSHHWSGFKLGFHYYPAADKFPVQPIVAGGGSFDL